MQIPTINGDMLLLSRLEKMFLIFLMCSTKHGEGKHGEGKLLGWFSILGQCVSECLKFNHVWKIPL